MAKKPATINDEFLDEILKEEFEKVSSENPRATYDQFKEAFIKRNMKSLPSFVEVTGVVSLEEVARKEGYSTSEFADIIRKSIQESRMLKPH